MKNQMDGEQRRGQGMDERDEERETLAVEDEDMAKAADADVDGSNNYENLPEIDLDLLDQTAIARRSLRRRALSKSRSRFVEDYSKNGRSFPEILSPRVQKVTVKDENDSVDRKKNMIKYSNMHMEALQNVRNTITVSAVLIATVAFGGCTNPPGGLHQDGPLIGKPTLGRAAAFKVFVVSNDVAMFLSLSIVLVLVSIIPFKKKPLRRLLAVIHKVMWVAVGFMITAYIAARWAIMDRTQEGGWMFATLVSVCGGLMAAVFVGLSMMVVRDRLKKWKCRERRRMNQVKSGIGRLSKSSSSASYIADFLEKGLGELFDLDQLESAFGGNNTEGFDIHRYAERMKEDDRRMPSLWTRANDAAAAANPSLLTPLNCIVDDSNSKSDVDASDEDKEENSSTGEGSHNFSPTPASSTNHNFSLDDQCVN